MNDEIKTQILAGEFKKASAQIASFDKNLFDFLAFAAYDSGSITFYGFLTYLIFFNESISLHYMAADLLIVPLCHIEGAYALAFFHAHRILELEPNNIKHKEFLLFFHTIPDKLLAKEEAISIARDVLKEDPKSEAAREILQKYNLDI